MNPQLNPSKPIADPVSVIESWQQDFEIELTRLLSTEDHTPGKLLESMRYSALSGGKRIRPMLVYASGLALNLNPRDLHGIALAIEIIHTYSLIHDDLPAMDDDDLRRGRPTNHCKFDDATAILAGDALQALAFEVLATDPNLSRTPDPQVRIIGEIATACGARGMAGGQVLDLAAVDQDVTYQDLETMHRMKTGALIRASVTAPSHLATTSPDSYARLARFGDCVGLAFQIHDDVLDVTATSHETGKPSQGDAARNKPAFPSVMGLEASRTRAAELRDTAVAELDSLTGDTSLLHWLAGYAIDRKS